MANEEKLREYLRRVTAELADARGRLAEMDQPDHEPLAVIGMSCRFPGADGVEGYWDLLREGRAAAVTDVPPGRFDHDPRAAANDLYPPRRGAFFPDVAGWDAGLFGYSPHEALRMDPQQRLLMELAWEAMEDAGTPPERLAGTRTGVLLGFSDAFQYGQLEAEIEGRRAYTDPYMGQGSLGSVVAGRIAYHFDLRGPAFSIDTACSSALVAVHTAARALQNRECDYVLAGGAYLALHPFLYIYSCAARLLSPTDECHTFDAAADGYLMGEGGGLVMLTRLADAQRAGHRIRAVIKGSAVNQDGRSNGLTAPSRGAQAAVIRQALSTSRTGPDEVAYLEAHGSGTSLGDQIELGALGDVFGDRAPDNPLHVGAVKTNLGHTHTAAGIAGLIKTILVLDHGLMPPNLHLAEPVEAAQDSPAVRPLTRATPLPGDGGAAAIAGVSSFGWSGTNAHVILQAPPTAAAADPAPSLDPAVVPAGAPAHLLPASAATEGALSEQLGRLAEAAGRIPLADLAQTVQEGRAALGWRRAVIAGSADEAAARLTAAASQPGTPRAQGRPRVAFLLPGTGDQYRGMGRELYRDQPAFAAAMDECVAVAERLGLDLRPLLLSPPPTAVSLLPGARPAAADELLEHAEIAHPYLFAVEYALASQLAAYGVTPDLLIGYSLGEYVAACLAGVFTLEDALSVIVTRARLIEAAPPGRMIAAAASAERVRELLGGSSQVTVAAENGPGMTVLSGPPAEAEAVVATLTGHGIAARVLRSAHPFHSVLLEPAQGKLAAAIAAVPRRAPRVPLLSNVTGRPLTDEQAADPGYWAAHLCQPVRFAAALRHCAERKTDAYVELGPGMTLGGLVRQNAAAGEQAAVLGTLPAPWQAGTAAESTALLETCGRLWELGLDLNWPALRQGAGTFADLPRYPFQRTAYWPRPAQPGTTEAGTPAFARPASTGPASAPEAGLCYTPSWRLDPARLPAGAPGLGGPLVIFSDAPAPGSDTAGDTAGARLAELAAQAGTAVIEVIPGSELRRTGRTIVIDPANPDHYRQVFAALDGPAEEPVQVVYLWPRLATAQGAAAAEDTDIRYAFDGLLLLIQSLAGLGADRETRLVTVTCGAEEIVGQDLTAPVQALAHGLARGARAEYPRLSWRGVDLPPDAVPETAARHLAEELRRGPWHYADPAAEPALAGWRGGRRWLKDWAELEPPAVAASWNPGDTCLITGGTRGLGLALARHLVAHGVRRLALVGRTDLNAPAPADAQAAQRHARSRDDMAALRAAGAEVLLLTADAGDPAQLRVALGAARDHFGALDVVVHAAGVPGGVLAQRRTPADARPVLAPKVRALGPLAELVTPASPEAAPPPRLLVLYSSVATVLGGLGESDYCAANSALNAYGTALAATAGQTQVVTVAWGQWQHDDWPSELTGQALADREEYRRSYGFSDEAGCQLLSQLAGGAVTGTVVAVRQRLPEAARTWSAFNDLGDLVTASAAGPGRARFPRPALRAEYAPPRSELETTIARAWSDYLGVDGVGIHDPFFDLGGNSLVGTAMVAALEQTLGRPVAPALLFQHPTVATFAAALGRDPDAAPARPSAATGRGERRRRAVVRTTATAQGGNHG